MDNYQNKAIEDIELWEHYLSKRDAGFVGSSYLTELIRLHETWTLSEALQFLFGIAGLDLDALVNNDEPGYAYDAWRNVRFFYDHWSSAGEDYSIIIPCEKSLEMVRNDRSSYPEIYLTDEYSPWDIVLRFERILTALWKLSSDITRASLIMDSCQLDDRNPPMFYIEWAEKKGVQIPWIEWARSEGLVPESQVEVSTALLDEQSLDQRERTTLLTIIAALAKEAKIDISKPSKAGVLIESMTEQMGARVGSRTVSTHLKRIQNALERRSK